MTVIPRNPSASLCLSPPDDRYPEANLSLYCELELDVQLGHNLGNANKQIIKLLGITQDDLKRMQ